MTRAFTTANLKVQSNVEKESESETPSELLPKPSQKLASSITTSCLKSFQEFHISPESKIVTEVDEENDLPVPRPKFARSNSKKFQKPAEVNCHLRIKSLCYNFSYVWSTRCLWREGQALARRSLQRRELVEQEVRSRRHDWITKVRKATTSLWLHRSDSPWRAS